VYTGPVRADTLKVHAPLGVFVGLATLDVVHHVTARPGPDEKVTARRQFVAAGGPAAGAAVTFAALGGRSRLVTALGSGPVAALIKADLAACGVDVVDVDPDGELEPAVSAIVVDPAAGTRSVVSPDATGSTASSTAPDLIAGADVVLVDGHHQHLATAAAHAAARAGIDLLVDGGRWKPVFSQLIPSATAMLCSAAFRLPQHGEHQAEATVAELVARGVPLVVTTHGPDSVRWWADGRSGLIDVSRVEAVDTLGAGDAFHGAYAWSSRQGGTIADHLRFAVRIAGLKCASPGPRDWLAELPQPAL
jgi:sugar/nucleoside kinase (ribokinase family)